MHIHSIVGFCVQIIHNPVAEITAKNNQPKMIIYIMRSIII